MASVRLPGKPLLPLGGRAVVQWVHDAALQSGVFEEVLVATDDERICQAVTGFGGRCVMTESALATGSERVAAAAAPLLHDFDVVVNVQGDQPFVEAQHLQALVAPYREGLGPDMTTLAAPLDPALADDPGAVKLVTDLTGYALYFSRSRIPAAAHPAAGTPGLLRHHLGLYGFRADFLPRYAQLTPSPLELAEQLEQLRALEHGHRIMVRDVASAPIEINTPADYDRAVSYVAEAGLG
jgi:3-deoxy-manno-octulosonate cytidylyltransferase (CMP-KDO synthetase)